MTVYIGIDWSEKKHDVCFVNGGGEVIQTLQIPHTPQGFVQFDQARQQMGASPTECRVGIETSHSMLIDFLLEQGYGPIYVLPPNTVKSSQGRYRQSGAKSDRQDARLIADMVRMDGEQYHAWVPDSALTRQIRARISLVDYLTHQIWQMGNRLRAALLRYYPVALEVFSDLDSPITLAWIQQYPTPQAAQAVSFAQFQAFAKDHHHTRPKSWAQAYARLQPPPGPGLSRNRASLCSGGPIPRPTDAGECPGQSSFAQGTARAICPASRLCHLPLFTRRG